MFVLFLPRTVEKQAAAFPSEAGNALAEGRASAAQTVNDSGPFTLRSVGDSIKSLPCDLLTEKRAPAESQKTKAIRGGRLVCARHRDTFLKASIMDKLLVVAVESD